MKQILLSSVMVLAASYAFALPVKNLPEKLAEQTAGLELPAPYIPAVSNQLMTLGKADKPRFEVKDISWPATTEAAEICLWKDDKVAAISLTIDDNCQPDHDWWLEQCRRFGLKVTFFAIAGGIDHSFFSGKWDQWRAFASNDCINVQSHTLNHQGKDSQRDPEEVRLEYAGSQALLNAKLPGHRCVALAYPCGSGRPDIASRYFIACRGVFGVPNPANAINYMSVNIGQFGEGAFEVLTTGKTDKEPKWLNNRRNYRGWCAALWHYVHQGKTPAACEAAAAKVSALLERLATAYKDTIWVDFFVDIAKYGQERDSAVLKVVSSAADRIELTLTDLMRDDLFDYPLTLKVRLPDGWTNAHAVQGDAPVALRVVTHDGARFALVDGVPDRGPIILSRR